MNELRFDLYQTALIKSTFKLEKLPPTIGAAKQHILRAYHQLHTWLGNKKDSTDWGWKINKEGTLIPNYTDEQLIPDSLLETIFCGCTKGCNNTRCSCRKHGLKCTNLCKTCSETDVCSNIEVQQIEEDDDNETISDLLNVQGHERIINQNEEVDREGYEHEQNDEEHEEVQRKRARYE